MSSNKESNVIHEYLGKEVIYTDLANLILREEVCTVSTSLVVEFGYTKKTFVLILNDSSGEQGTSTKVPPCPWVTVALFDEKQYNDVSSKAQAIKRDRLEKKDLTTQEVVTMIEGCLGEFNEDVLTCKVSSIVVH